MSLSQAVVTLCASAILASAQPNYYYRSADATGRLVRTAVTNLMQASTSLRASAMPSRSRQPAVEFPRRIVTPQPRTAATLRSLGAPLAPVSTALSARANLSVFGFPGLTHYDQRNANYGNQFSVEPPSPEIAAANGWILAGVNNAIQVYSTSGAPLLGRVLATNELFQVAPAIDRTTQINGVYPTDMRVFHDHWINRWFIVQRAQDYDAVGNPLNSSHLYIAVSQTGDPTGNYTIYAMDTTNASRPGCPCFSDYPQIGADQYGIYISSDEYDTVFGRFIDVSILAMSKSSLASGAVSPRVHEFVIPRLTGYEGTVRPAITPPGAVAALVRGGIEFFLSTQTLRYSDNAFALWALTNTASLNTVPDLTLIQTIIPGAAYVYPDVAAQRPGFLPYGSTLSPPGQLAFIDGGRDSRVLSLSYVAGRLVVTFATDATDVLGRRVVAGGWAVLLPSLRGNVLAAPVWRAGYLTVAGNHVLRPAVALDALGRGAIAFTLVGPDYYPSAAFVPVSGFLPGSVVQIASFGVAPQDGFTGYPDNGFVSTGVARWGDYSCAVATADGSVWIAAEHIPGGLRTELANWGTHIFRYGP